MRAAVFLALVMLTLPPAARADMPLALTGAAVQGGLLMGETAPGAALSVDGAPHPVSPDGHFLLGFGRDDEGPVSLVATKGGEEARRVIEIAKRSFQIERIDGLPPRSVTPDPADLERIKREAAEIAEARQRTDPDLGYLAGFQWPAEGRISGVYGSQRILNGNPRAPHYGTDIAAPIGTRVRAVAAGRVAFVHPGMFFNGKTVLLDHGLGLRSVYIHLSETTVSAGDRVAAGDVIGAIGQTGRATGPHLHFALTLGTVQLDPEVVIGAPRQ